MGPGVEGTTSAVGEVASSPRRHFSCNPVRKVAPAENASVTTASRSTTVAAIQAVHPESVAADATAEVQRLESAIAALGEKNPHAKALVEALRVARVQSKVPPIQQRIQSCKTYIERAGSALHEPRK